MTLSDGSPIDPEKLYAVVMPDFIAMGGDGTQSVMNKLPRERIRISFLKPIRDIIVDVVSRWPQPVSPRIEGRITVLGLPPGQQ